MQKIIGEMQMLRIFRSLTIVMMLYGKSREQPLVDLALQVSP